MEASEVYQQEQMDQLGMNASSCDLRDAYPFGGGLHCSTADVYREGSASTTSRTASRIPPSCAPRCGSKSLAAHAMRLRKARFGRAPFTRVAGS